MPRMRGCASSTRVWLDAKFFEHLLNCMGNQKFIAELEPKDRIATQDAIDRAYEEGQAILRRWRESQARATAYYRKCEHKPKVSKDDKEED